MYQSSHLSIPMRSSMSLSSSCSWDSSNSGSLSEHSGPGIVVWCNIEAREGSKSSHGLVWGPNYDATRAEGERADDVFWSSATARQSQIIGGLVEGEIQWDKPDLLDSLIMEDREEKMRKMKAQSKCGTANLQLPSLENLLKLVELQSNSNPPEGRPITGANGLPPPSTQYQDMVNAQAILAHHVPLVFFSGQFPPINFKVPPPHHPPAVPASFHLPPSPMHPITPTPPSPNPTLGSATVILLRVDEALWQFQALEKERKKTEAALAKQNPGKRISSSNSVQIPRLPLGPTRLDKLVVNCMREQARVVTLLDKIEKMKGKTFSPELHSSLSMWKESMMMVMAIRRRERVGQAGRDSGRELGDVLANMSGETRKARTLLWAVMLGGTRSD